MTVDQHRVLDPPVPGGARHEIIQGTATLSSGAVDETITLELSYSNKPTITASAGNGATDEEVTATLQDDDPTSNNDIVIELNGTTDEAKEYHVHVVSPVGEE
jgi:hypothetical protein